MKQKNMMRLKCCYDKSQPFQKSPKFNILANITKEQEYCQYLLTAQAQNLKFKQKFKALIENLTNMSSENHTLKEVP